MRLKINETKSAVASITGRKFPSYRFWFAKDGVKRNAATKALATFKQRVRQLTRRSGGRSMAEVLELVRPFFGMSLLRAGADAGHLAHAG